jgi:integrase
MAAVKKRKWKGADGRERSAWRVDFTDSNGVRKRRQFERKDHADRFRISVEGQVQAGTYRGSADKVTVKEVAETYIAELKARQARCEITRRHTEMVEGKIWNYICPDAARAAKQKRGSRRAKPFSHGVGAVKLSQLTPPTVKQFAGKLRDAGVSVPTTRKIVGTLHAILEYAVSENLVAVNAARRIRVKGRRDEGSKKIVPPSKDALRRLIAVADPDFQIELIFAAATGVRAGELHALRWRHIDLDKPEIKIETRVDSHHEEDAPKSKAGFRTVPIGADVVKRLRAWKVKSKFSKVGDLVFPNSKGKFKAHSRLLQDQFYPLFAKLTEQHEADPDNAPPAPTRFGWHALRHFAVSSWIAEEMAPKAVQTFAGHSTLAMTMSTYGHLFPSDDHGRAMDAIAKELF